MRQSRRYAKTGEAEIAGSIDEHIRGFDVLVDEAAPVCLAECRRQARGEPQEPPEIEGAAEQAIEGLAAAVLEHESSASAMANKRQRPSRPPGIKVGGERVFVLEALEARKVRSPGDEGEDRDWISGMPGAV